MTPFVPDKLQSLFPFPVLLQCDHQQLSDLQKETEWIHWNCWSLTAWFFEFLEMCCHLHFEANLNAILSKDCEFNVFSFLLIRPQVLSWQFCLLGGHDGGGFTQGLCTVVALGRQNLTLDLQIHLSFPQHNTADGGTSARHCITLLWLFNFWRFHNIQAFQKFHLYFCYKHYHFTRISLVFSI